MCDAGCEGEEEDQKQGVQGVSNKCNILRCESKRLYALNISLTKRNDDVMTKLEVRSDLEARQVTKDLNDDLKRQNGALVAHMQVIQNYNTALGEMLQKSTDGQAALQMHKAAELVVKGLASAEKEVQMLKTSLRQVEEQRDNYKHLLARANSELLSAQAYTQISMSDTASATNTARNNIDNDDKPEDLSDGKGMSSSRSSESQQQQSPPQRMPAHDRKDMSRSNPEAPVSAAAAKIAAASSRTASASAGAQRGDTIGGTGVHPNLGSVSRIGKPGVGTRSGGRTATCERGASAALNDGLDERKGSSQEPMDVYSDSEEHDQDKVMKGRSSNRSEGVSKEGEEGEEGSENAYDSDSAPSMFF